MRLTLLELAALSWVLAGFALLAAGARGQPWADQFCRFGRLAETGRVMLSCLMTAGACAVLAPRIGWTEAALFTLVALALVASAFVLLAAALPRLAWTAAALSPALGALAALAAWWVD